ncbi:MAG TPA: BTAD domain-containing putative transcriptional regulator [Baekduia sp.]|nr:BTAD domain-containing putative transcriptional regulator [Baekduia sp.]
MQTDTEAGQRDERLPLIGRKLAIPAPPEHVVARPRLDGLLATLFAHYRIVVVAATAGAGKSTAVARAARAGERRVAWLTVDRTDTAPGRLLTYLEGALARAAPGVAGLATRALAAGLPHPEAAGLLADALGEQPVLVVLDELERLEEAPEAWAVVEAFLRYAPPTTCVVLLSRRELPAEHCSLPPMHQVAVLGEEHLAFTAEEAVLALHELGRGDVDPEGIVGATGGWVTGVLFEAWRASDHVAGVGGEADPLNGYLATHIMAGLPPADQEFLISTSVLDEVDVGRAAALGLADAGARLESLRRAHLPVTWAPRGFRMRCHSRFREYLQSRLERRGPDALRGLHLAHGRLLAREGADEEAVEELLQAGAADEALPVAERAIVRIIERLDVAIAQRWLDVFQDLAPSGASAMTTAELMLAIGRDDLRSAVRIADQLQALGERDALAEMSSHAALFMSWAYLHVGRLDDIAAVLDAAGPGPMTSAVRYAAEILVDVPRSDATMPPALSGGPLDALISLAHYAHGRLTELTDGTQSPWVQAVVAPYRIAALRALGHTHRALELYEASSTAAWADWAVPDLLLDAGRIDDARAFIARCRADAEASGSIGFQGFVGLAEAKLALRVDRDPAAARASLDRIERLPDARRLLIVGEMLDCWYGLALLLEGRDGEALTRLRAAVASMTAGDRILELPTAATYLAEACWRAGDEQGADRAADLALDAARRQGSNHLLLQALADVPAVLSRRLDAEPAADSPWHVVGRAFMARAPEAAPALPSAVRLHEFGRRAIVVGGEEHRPRLKKTHELLAYLTANPGREVGREELLDALFDGRSDDSTRAHLRQAMQGLRQALPGDESVRTGKGGWQLADDLRIVTDSGALEAGLQQAARLQGEERLEATLTALALFEQGEYLPGPRSAWAEQRAEALAALVDGARLEAAELAYAAGRMDTAAELCQAVLERDPFREVAWRLQMRIASAVGDDDGVIRGYQACERALAATGASPSRTTRSLLDELRR